MVQPRAGSPPVRRHDPPSPPLQAELRAWERCSARAVHLLLLGAMFVLPASGYVISTSAGSGFPFLSALEVPALLPRSETARDLAITIHYVAAYGLLPFVAVHAGAALKHQFIDKHGTLQRML
ncbi:MAG: cytochrome b/b6 domain-containing protein [Rhodospirillales bacterium]|nr:cytochrome b/b6 domain-containing protein [Rhodospirillales bacterium]